MNDVDSNMSVSQLANVLTSFDMNLQSDKDILEKVSTALNSNRQIETLRRMHIALLASSGVAQSEECSKTTLLLLEKEIEIINLRNLVLALDTKYRSR